MNRPRPSFTTLSLVALVAGLAIGATARALGNAPLTTLATGLAPVGTLWTNALRMTVIPLVLSSLLLAVAANGGGRAVGRLGAMSVAAFIVLLALGAVVTAVLVPPVLHALPQAAFQLGVPGANPATPPAEPAVPSLSEWFVALVPVNPFRAAADGDILPLIVFTLPFALALTRVRAELKGPFLDGTRAVYEAMFVLLRWILWVGPLGIFCLTFDLAARTGVTSLGSLGTYIALIIGLLLAFTVLLYPLTALIGRVPLGRFARGVARAQIVAAGTRSSLAALPSLVRGAEHELRLPPPVTGFVLPLAVAMFRMNRTLSSTAKLLFLAQVYGMPLALPQVGVFAASVLLLSFTTPGLPSTGSVTTIPLYLSFGIPIEGVVILSAVDAVPDIFKTVTNVTAQGAVGTMVARLAGMSPRGATAAAEALPEEA